MWYREENAVQGLLGGLVSDAAVLRGTVLSLELRTGDDTARRSLRAVSRSYVRRRDAERTRSGGRVGLGVERRGGR